MRPRTLRLLASILVLFGGLIYLVSATVRDLTPVTPVDRGNPGSPVSGLSHSQYQRFLKYKEFFQRHYPEIVSKQPLGLGLINSIPDLSIEYMASAQHGNRHHRPSAGIPRIVLGLPDTMNRVGRFGAKGETSALLMQCQLLLGQSKTIGTQSTALEPTTDNGGPDSDALDKARIPQRLQYYLSLLAPPEPLSETPLSLKGQSVFNRISCAVCHQPTYQSREGVWLFDPEGSPPQWVKGKTPDGRQTLELLNEPKLVRLRALEEKPVRAYSDFLLHDLSDPQAQPGQPQPSSSAHLNAAKANLSKKANQVSTVKKEEKAQNDISSMLNDPNAYLTAPLWGLRYKKNFMHNGKAASIEEAIRMHGGQAKSSADQWRSLDKESKDALAAFLQSL